MSNVNDSVDRAQAAVRAAWDAYQAERTRLEEGEAGRGIGMPGLNYYREVHPLWTPQMAAIVPPLAAVDTHTDPLCYFRMVAPHRDDCQWFVLAAQPDGDDVLLLVYVCLADPENAEVGYVALSELRAIRGPWLLNVETDPDWKPRPLSEVKRLVRT
jgi:hypothetical protein